MRAELGSWRVGLPEFLFGPAHLGLWLGTHEAVGE